MPIRVTCACGKLYIFKDEFAGRFAKCPACGQVVIIPGLRPGAVAPTLSSLPRTVLPAPVSEEATPQQNLDLDCNGTPAENLDWPREKSEILDALHSDGEVDKAWALDLLNRYAQQGVEEAMQLLSEHLHSIAENAPEEPVRRIPHPGSTDPSLKHEGAIPSGNADHKPATQASKVAPMENPADNVRRNRLRRRNPLPMKAGDAFGCCLGLFGFLGFAGGGIGGLVVWIQSNGQFSLLAIPLCAIGGAIGGAILGAIIGALAALVVTLMSLFRRRTIPKAPQENANA